ncbi:uncharacterized protein LOC116463625 [Hylobates moloch]|uniref:uncharacterized protein LOC116463625 n=1 Tax=Hylobates moloch TaxID=81572 RepID=UPI0013643A7A|nr:uncharacterized protein LOC116463625 [Hylobates moloch]
MTGSRAPLLPRTRIWSLTFSRKTSPVGARPGAAPRCGGGKVRASAVAKCPLPLKAHLRLRFRTARGDRQVAKRGGRRTLPPSLRMPEGPELHLASQFVNEACRALVFGGCVEKSSVSRNPEVPFESSAYRISASAGSKELRLILSPLPGAQPPRSRWSWSSASACPALFSWCPASSCHAMPTCAFTRPRLAPGSPYVSWTSAGSATGTLGESGSRAAGPVSCRSTSSSGRASTRCDEHSRGLHTWLC